MRNIIIPVDFSSTSATAIKFGTHLAELMHCNIHVVHVSDLVLSGAHSLTTPEQQKDEKALEEKLTVFARKYVSTILAEDSGRTDFIPSVTLSVQSGSAAGQIITLSQEPESALIVMGGVGAGAGLQLPGLYGSVATPVAIKGGCPVILIPEGYKKMVVERLAIAFDDADEIVRIGKVSKRIINVLKPEVRYVHVSKANWRKELENEDDFLDLSWGKGLPSYIYESDVLPAGDVARQLSRYVVDTGIDLLILGGKRQGFWSRLFDKNNLKPIIKSVSVPMMVIPFSVEDDAVTRLGKEISRNIY